MMTSAEIRDQFLQFFRSKQHVIVPSAPIVLKDDPTLLFTNAGMNQFKDYFLGNKTARDKRVADTQKCLRVSGKHNDLEEVGVDTYHHTMFEMLGNWSFGDYFKKEAIAWSWELLTEKYGIPKDKLYVTVFAGDEKENLPRDEEALSEWKKWISEDRILMGKKKDNFWEMGDTGPCGPCTEIHVDCRTEEERKQEDGKKLVNNDHPQVIEIWNNVFIQFNRLKDGTLESLPARHVDTGMGLERLVRVLQQKTSNYDTDIFSGTIAETERITKKRYDYGSSQQAIAFRVIADHIRAISFTIADRQLPSNTGAGYVIRRILRRAVRYYYSFLQYDQPLLYQLVPVLSLQFQNVFSELHLQADFISRVVREEEEAFLRTIKKGIGRFNNYVIEGDGSGTGHIEGFSDDDSDTMKSYIDIQTKYITDRKNKRIAGEFAFELNDTYGFPIDLTELMAKEKGWTVDIDGFNMAMKQQKQRSRAATTLDTEDWVSLAQNTSSKFVGYDLSEIQTNVSKYRKVKTKGKEAFQLILDTTPFYAESGGQVGDTGTLLFDGEVIRVADTKKENDLIIHVVENLPVNITAAVTASIDKNRRNKIQVHHSATHLLHAALRKVLGTHVTQKGSLVNDEYLRFDFSHFSKMTDEEIEAVEKLVNEKIRENIPVIIREMPKEEALQLGAMALFGEKYGDVVRVIVIDPQYSVELCGGTHVGATGELGLFKITAETAIGAGVRRVEAVSGFAAEQYLQKQLSQLRSIRESLKNPKDLIRSIEELSTENSLLRKKVESMENRMLVGIRNELLQKDEIINGITFIGDIIEVGNPEALKKLCYDLKNNLNDYVAVLCSNIGGKASVAIGISDTVVSARKLDAGKILKEHVAELIKGGGGGQKNLATAGGQDASNLAAVISKVKSLL